MQIQMMKDILPIIVASLFAFMVVNHGGYLAAMKNEARMTISGSSIESPENSPVFGRRKLVELMDQHLIPDMDIDVDSLLKPPPYVSEFSNYWNNTGFSPVCHIGMGATPTTYPLNERVGKKYHIKRETFFYLVLFHEVSHCVFRYNGLDKVLDPRTEEAFADSYAFLLLFRHFGYSSELMNIMDVWTRIRKTFVEYKDHPDLEHDSVAALIYLRKEIMENRMPEDKDMVRFAVNAALLR